MKRKATGTPKQLAQKLEISERQLYNLIDLMRDLGAPVRYSQSSQSYLYTKDVDWSFGFKQKVADLKNFR